MASRIFSIRLDDTAVEALEAVQSTDDDSLNATAKRVLLDALGIDVNIPVHTVNNDERLQELVDNKTAYLADAMNDVKSQLEDEIGSLKIEMQEIKIALEEMRSLSTQVLDSPVTTKTTLVDDDPQSEIAIAPKVTSENVALPQASKPLSAGEIKSKVNSIARTLQDKGHDISRTIIRGKILEMYPNSEDWLSDDARKDIIRVLEKEYK